MRYDVELTVNGDGWTARIKEDGEPFTSISRARTPREALAAAGEMITQRVIGQLQERLDAALAEQDAAIERVISG